jgi:hypothetical protein
MDGMATTGITIIGMAVLQDPLSVITTDGVKMADV